MCTVCWQVLGMRQVEPVITKGRRDDKNSFFTKVLTKNLKTASKKANIVNNYNKITGIPEITSQSVWECSQDYTNFWCFHNIFLLFLLILAKKSFLYKTRLHVQKWKKTCKTTKKVPTYAKNTFHCGKQQKPQS